MNQESLPCWAVYRQTGARCRIEPVPETPPWTMRAIFMDGITAFSFHPSQLLDWFKVLQKVSPFYERLMSLEVVQNWTDFSYDGDGEERLIKSTPYGSTPYGTPIYGRRHVRKHYTDPPYVEHWEHSEMVLIDYLWSPAWIHLDNPQWIE